ncbi:MAG: hypothetical protein Q4F84_03375 [Fibrobacter sp.]|nr:hypothetical protein [Fibrobacter sp.]
MQLFQAALLQRIFVYKTIINNNKNFMLMHQDFIDSKSEITAMELLAALQYLSLENEKSIAKIHDTNKPHFSR